MAQVKKLIEDVSGAKEERERAKKEVSQMVMMANAKLDAMESQLRDMFRNKELEGQIEIVGDRMGAFSREYRVNYSDGNMSKAIDELVSSIMGLGEGDTRNLISRIITNSLNAMFTSVTSTEEEKRMFIVMLESAALVRYDFSIWRSAEADSGIFQHCQSVVAITYARSVVDHTKVSEDELNDAINRFLGGNAPIDSIIAYKKKLIELLNIHTNKADINRPAGVKEDDLLGHMAGIPLDYGKVEHFVNDVHMTEESSYVAALLKEQEEKHA